MASKRRLSVGDLASVVDPVLGGLAPNNLRELPDRKATLIAQIQVNTRVKIIDGPCEPDGGPMDGWVWWIVRIVDGDGKPCNDRIRLNVGWMNEWKTKDQDPQDPDGEYNLEPV